MEKPKGFIPVRNLVENGKYFRVAVYSNDKICSEEVFTATGKTTYHASYTDNTYKWYKIQEKEITSFLDGLVSAHDYGIDGKNHEVGTFPATKENLAYASFLVEKNDTAEFLKILKER